MTDEIDKLDLPEVEKEEEKKEEEKKEEESKGQSHDVERAFLESINKGAKVFDLDNLKVASLKNLPQFPDSTEQISLFGNLIENPNDIAEVLVPLPNLRALWLNDNPVVETCSNFSMIAESMPKLEILNS